MYSSLLNKPVKFVIDNPIHECPMDYELVGKVLDNFIIKAKNDNVDIFKVGSDKSITFNMGYMYEYKLRVITGKSFYEVRVNYVRDIPKSEAKTINKDVLPKDKMKAAYFDKLAKEKAKELKDAEDKKTVKRKPAKKKV